VRADGARRSAPLTPVNGPETVERIILNHSGTPDHWVVLFVVRQAAAPLPELGATRRNSVCCDSA